MNSRFIPITVATLSFALVIFFVAYFEGVWRWMVAIPVYVFVTWPAFRVGLFSPQEEVDRMTGADKLGAPINPLILALKVVPSSRIVIYGIAVYLGYIGYSLYIVLLLAVFVCLVKTFTPIRFRSLSLVTKRFKRGLLAAVKQYTAFYIDDTIRVSIAYGIGYFVGRVF